MNDRASEPGGLIGLNEQIIACEACPRLREHCLSVAQHKRAAYRDWDYWGKPVPNLLPRPSRTDPPESARLLLVGLAPAAHGANRTGRMFTGDRSGDFLFRAMHEAGFANQPQATHVGDGLELIDAAVTAVCHCAPPQNKPTSQELRTCRPWLERTFRGLPSLRVVLCLGRLAFEGVTKLYQDWGWVERRSGLKFGHAAEHRLPTAPTLLCSYHPSQQNTFTGRLTPEMLRAVFERAAELMNEPRPPGSG